MTIETEHLSNDDLMELVGACILSSTGINTEFTITFTPELCVCSPDKEDFKLIMEEFQLRLFNAGNIYHERRFPEDIS